MLKLFAIIVIHAVIDVTTARSPKYTCCNEAEPVHQVVSSQLECCNGPRYACAGGQGCSSRSLLSVPPERTQQFAVPRPYSRCPGVSDCGMRESNMTTFLRIRWYWIMRSAAGDLRESVVLSCASSC